MKNKADNSATGQMLKDITFAKNMCQLLPEMDTLDALAEYWQEEIYVESDKEHYKKIRKDTANNNNPSASAAVETLIDDDDDVVVEYNKWEVDLANQNRGPDRCLLGHALHRCENTSLLVLDEEDDSLYRTVNGGQCKYKYCKKNDNINSGIAIMIDYLSEVFYACKFDCCHFAVHEACYGGERMEVSKLQTNVAQDQNQI